MAEKVAGIGDEAVMDATGKPWAAWFDVLDAAGGADLDHKERVAALAEAGVESGWWQQQLAVGYEQERGLREPGETADAGYQVGVQRTLPISRAALWALLTAEEGLGLWLGDVGPLAIEPGTTFETTDGTTGAIRTKRDGERLRLTWRPAGRDGETTLQLTLEDAASDEEKTVLRVHHEKLANGEEREEMREHWTRVLEGIKSAVASGEAP